MESLGLATPVTEDSPHARPTIALAETCRVVDGSVPLWPLHRERLREGGCGEVVLADIERTLAIAIAEYDDGPSSRIRAHLEVAPDGRCTAEVVRRLSSLDVLNGPCIAAVAEAEVRPAGPPLVQTPCAVKPADRSWWDAAARVARRRGAHQAIICDAEGFVIDGSSASVWAVIDGELVTPPAPPAIAGVARRFVLARASETGLAARVRPLALQELDVAAEVFLTNAFGGAVAVRGRGGPVSEQVAEWFADVWPRGGGTRRPSALPSA